MSLADQEGVSEPGLIYVKISETAAATARQIKVMGRSFLKKSFMVELKNSSDTETQG